MKDNDKSLACERVVSELRKSIFAKQLKPGQELVQEKIANDFKISRMPVRQALQILASEGLITLRKNRSAIVNNINFSDMIDHFEIRGLLEAEAAAYAAIRGDDFSKIIEMSKLAKSCLDNEDIILFSEYNRKYHEAIWEQAKSPKLTALLYQMSNNLFLAMGESPRQRIEKSCAEHDMVLNAIILRKPMVARTAMYDHVVGHLKVYGSQYNNKLDPISLMVGSDLLLSSSSK